MVYGKMYGEGPSGAQTFMCLKYKFVCYICFVLAKIGAGFRRSRLTIVHNTALMCWRRHCRLAGTIATRDIPHYLPFI